MSSSQHGHPEGNWLSRLWVLVAAAVALASLVGTIFIVQGRAGTDAEVTADAEPRVDLRGRVVDELGNPLPGATVEAAGSFSAVTDAGGQFVMRVPARPQLVTGRIAGYLPRTQASEPGIPSELRLTSNADETVSLRFGGDVMFGRRFYDRNLDGVRDDASLAVDATVEDHAKLLEQVEPLLADATSRLSTWKPRSHGRSWRGPVATAPQASTPPRNWSSPALRRAPRPFSSPGSMSSHSATTTSMTRLRED